MMRIFLIGKHSLMQIKVTVKYELWPYEETFSVTIPPEEVSKLDTYVDSITSNMKVRMLTALRTQHPTVWHQNTPLNILELNNLKHTDANTV